MHRIERTPEGLAREAAAREDHKRRGLRAIPSTDWTVQRRPFKATARGLAYLAKDREERYGQRGPESVSARFGFHYIQGNSAPYFSLIGDVCEYPTQSSRDWVGGCCHELIVQAYPTLAPLVPWHLCDQNGTPHGYDSTGAWAFRSYRGLQGGAFARAPYRDEDAKMWAHGILAGALDEPGETADADVCREFLMTGRPDAVVDWIARRQPVLQAKFRATMERFRVPMIPGHLETVVLETKPDGSPLLVRHDWLAPEGVDLRDPCIPYADRPSLVNAYTLDEQAADTLTPTPDTNRRP